ncbi:MAG: MarR family transcriptional regulator [Bacteroidales bacterium]|nr:MarR family transcriptional regulator [Bacteroidales bacterium]
MTKIDNEIIIKIRQIVRSINLESKKIQKEYGVSIPQVLCLSYIRDAPNFQTTQKNIRNYLNLNASTVTGIINRLEKKGYIARLPKLGDKRITSITLTGFRPKITESAAAIVAGAACGEDSGNCLLKRWNILMGALMS